MIEINPTDGQEPDRVQLVAPNPTPRVRPARLRTLSGVRRELARVYADARSGVLEPSHATRLAYILTCLQKMLEVESIELRLDALEERSSKTSATGVSDASVAQPHLTRKD